MKITTQNALQGFSVQMKDFVNQKLYVTNF